MSLPDNVRVQRHGTDHWRIWLYGESYSGKTYLANQFGNVLMLNSDGNTNEIDAPVLRIANESKVEGSIIKTKLAWDVFKDAIADLKRGTTFQVIVLDLIEDFYEHCRLYMYDKLKITHESDDSFRAWDKVRTEFFSTIRDLLSLPYNFILISQEDKSRDITGKGGDKITAIKPNINEKVAIKLAGMVTLTARVVNDHGNRTVQFKNSDVVFGGGRVQINVSEIPCEKDRLLEILEEKRVTDTPVSVADTEPVQFETADQPPVEAETPEEPIRRRRRVVE